MTEQQWLEEGRPARLWDFLVEHHLERLTERKCRLLCSAFRACSDHQLLRWIFDYRVDGSEIPVNSAIQIAGSWCHGQYDYDPLQSEKVFLIRDFFGNPFRPVVRENSYLTDAVPNARVHAAAHLVWEQGPKGREGDELYRQTVDSMVLREKFFSTQTVSLAQQSYDQLRPDGSLDPFFLGLTADSLEDSGLPFSGACEDCVDGDVGCPHCEGAGIYYDPPYSLKRFNCPHCQNGLLPDKCKTCNGTGFKEHPLLTNLRVGNRPPYPKQFRGSWGTDLLLSYS